VATNWSRATTAGAGELLLGGGVVDPGADGELLLFGGVLLGGVLTVRCSASPPPWSGNGVGVPGSVPLELGGDDGAGWLVAGGGWLVAGGG
jgi:hypothetical protein